MLKQAWDTCWQARYDAVHALYAQGISKRGIARQLKLSCQTVRKYLDMDSCPTYSRSTPAIIFHTNCV